MVAGEDINKGVYNRDRCFFGAVECRQQPEEVFQKIQDLRGANDIVLSGCLGLIQVSCDRCVGGGLRLVSCSLDVLCGRWKLRWIFCGITGLDISSACL